MREAGGPYPCPMEPHEDGWVEDIERAEYVERHTPPASTSLYRHTKAWRKGPVLVISSAEIHTENQRHMWFYFVPVSRYGRTPRDEIVEDVRRVFQMEKADEIAKTRHQRMLRLKNIREDA